MQSCGEYGLVLLDVLDCPIKRQFHQDLIADLQLLLVSRHAHRKLVDQPIAEMFHVGAPASGAGPRPSQARTVDFGVARHLTSPR
jgi:hypothetical protein